MIKCKLYFFLFFYSFFSNISFAQNAELKFDVVNAEQGLLDESVEDAIEDSDGFIWIATYNGLFRYDGYTCSHFQANENDSSTISYNEVTGLAEDNSGNFWLSYRHNGIAFYNKTNKLFYGISIPETNDSIRGLKLGVNSIIINDSLIWIATAYGIGKYSPSLDTWKWYTKTYDSTSFNSDYSCTIAISDSGTIWSGFCNSSQLLYYDKKTDAFRYFTLPNGNDYWISGGVTAIHLKAQKLWIGTYQNGLIQYDFKTKKARSFVNDKSDNTSLGANEVWSIFTDSKSRLWVGVINGGLNLFNPKTNTFAKYVFDEKNKYSISSNSVVSINETHNGDIIIGTHAGGLNIINERKNRIQYIGRTSDIQKGLLNQKVHALYEDNEGYIWIGTDGGGLCKYDSKSGLVTHYTAPENISSNSVLDIEPNGDGRLWLATWSGGVCLFDPETQTSKVYKTDASKSNWISKNNIKGVCKDGDYIWIASHGNGLNIYDIKNNVFYNEKNKTERFPFDFTQPFWNNDIVKDSKENMWISTIYGLFKWDGKKLHSYFNSKNDSTSLTGDYISMVYEDTKHNIWVCTNTLLKYNAKNNDFIRYNSIHKNLPANVKAIQEDRNGLLWLSTSSGLYMYNPSSGEVQNYTFSDGLQGNSFITKSCFTRANGELLWGGDEGLNIIKPEIFQQNTELPKVFITKMNIWEQPSEARQNSYRNYRNVLSIPHKEFEYDVSRYISFEFVAPGYQSPERKQYVYWLEGFDTTKIATTNERKAIYTNLPPGNYTFHVIASNCDGYWNEAGTTLDFRIKPPWWGTWWFRVFIILILLSLIILIIKKREKKIQFQKRFLEEEVRNRTLDIIKSKEEIEMQFSALQSQKQLIDNKNRDLKNVLKTKDKLISIIGHDLRAPIASIVSLTDLLQDTSIEKKEGKDIVSYIHKASIKLINQFEKLSDWAKNQEGKIDYSPQDTDISFLVFDIINFLNETAKQKGISFFVKDNLQNSAFVDSRMVSAVIRNLLGNSIKFAHSKSNITVELQQTKDKIEIAISDSGVGISQEQLNKLHKKHTLTTTLGTNNEQGTGLGLKLCFDFVIKNKGTLEFESIEGVGTTANITLPIGKAITKSSYESQFNSQEHLQADINVSFKNQDKIIVIIEDDEEYLALLKTYFSPNFKIQTASNGIEGLELVNSVIPDIVISDIQLPGKNGKDICHEIKSNTLTNHIIVYLISSEGNPEQIVSGLKLGADDYFTKPLDIKILSSKLYSAINNRIIFQKHIKKQIIASQSISESVSTEKKYEDKFVEDFIKTIEAQIQDNKLSVDTIAESMYMSRTQLYRKSISILGESPIDFINNYKLQKAATYLKTTSKNISEIAYDVGFSDARYFSKCFSKLFGKTPTQYSKEYKKR